MKNQKGFSLTELWVMFLIMTIVVLAALPLLNGKSDNNTKEEIRNAEINYSEYTKKCIKGQAYMVSKNGDIRQILTENKDSILCEEPVGTIEQTSNIEVNANPYTQTN